MKRYLVISFFFYTEQKRVLGYGEYYSHQREETKLTQTRLSYEKF